MPFRLLADLIVVVHFAWILFMLAGFILTLIGFWWKRLFDKWLFRTLHLLGIVYVGLLAVLREYCPLTILENALREKYDLYLTYPGSFIVHYLQRLVYPDIQPLMILIPTMIIAIFTILVFIFRPPRKIKRIFVKFFL